MLQFLRARLVALWRWQRKESELDEEIAFHLSEEAAERAAAGLPADRARQAARKDFGKIGPRLALGARPAQIVGLVCRQGMGAILTGIGVGVAGSIALSKIAAGFLFGTSATDVPTFVAVVLLFAAIALVSTVLPVRRATAIDPTLAFRAE